MTRLVNWAKWLTTVAPGPGLFLIAFIDSSFFSLPEVNDILLIWLVMQHKERMLYYAAMSTLGSLVGCFIIYFIGRKGGEALLRRMGGKNADRWSRTFQKYGLVAVLVPAILPPPAPFKIFVLLAGMARVSVGTFAAAIVIGRGVRYVAEGTLAIWYGEAAVEYMKDNAKPVALALAGLIVVAAVVWMLWSRRRGSASHGD